jgi:hypothetical protein
VCSYAIWGSDATGITKETGRGVEGGKRNSPKKEYNRTTTGGGGLIIKKEPALI